MVRGFVVTPVSMIAVSSSIRACVAEVVVLAERVVAIQHRQRLLLQVAAQLVV